MYSKFWLRLSNRERERLPIYWFILLMLPWLALGQAKARSQTVPSDLPHGFTDPKTCGLFCSCRGCIIRKLNEKWSSQDSNQDPWNANMLCHNAGYPSYTLKGWTTVSKRHPGSCAPDLIHKHKGSWNEIVLGLEWDLNPVNGAFIRERQETFRT